MPGRGVAQARREPRRTGPAPAAHLVRVRRDCRKVSFATDPQRNRLNQRVLARARLEVRRARNPRHRERLRQSLRADTVLGGRRPRDQDHPDVEQGYSHRFRARGRWIPSPDIRGRALQEGRGAGGRIPPAPAQPARRRGGRHRRPHHLLPPRAGEGERPGRAAALRGFPLSVGLPRAAGQGRVEERFGDLHPPPQRPRFMRVLPVQR